MCGIKALPTTTALVGFPRQCLVMSEKTPTELAEELLAEKAELKKNKVLDAKTGQVGVRMMDMLVLETAAEAFRITPTQVYCRTHVNQHGKTGNSEYICCCMCLLSACAFSFLTVS